MCTVVCSLDKILAYANSLEFSKALNRYNLSRNCTNIQMISKVSLRPQKAETNIFILITRSKHFRYLMIVFFGSKNITKGSNYAYRCDTIKCDVLNSELNITGNSRNSILLHVSFKH